MTVKYQFIMTDTDDEHDSREIVHTVVGEQTWPELLMHFQDFLKGVGYIFNGELAVIDSDGNDVSDNVII